MPAFWWTAASGDESPLAPHYTAVKAQYGRRCFLVTTERQSFYDLEQSCLVYFHNVHCHLD